MATKKPAIGTVIRGTLRPEDLIPAFRKELAILRDSCRANVELPPNPDWKDADDVDEVLTNLFDQLDLLAPAAHHFHFFVDFFGAHPGDGSDFGFWEY